MLTTRLHPRPARLAAALALVPVLLVGGAGHAAAVPELPGSSPEPDPPPPSEPEPAPQPSPPPPATTEPAPARTTASAPAPGRSAPASRAAATPAPSPSAESAASSPVVSSPLPVGEVSGSPSPEPTASPTELDEEPVAETSTTDPLIRLVFVAVAAGLLLGAAGAVGLYLTRKSRGVHR